MNHECVCSGLSSNSAVPVLPKIGVPDSLASGDAVPAVITTTEDHPFWNATDHQWQPAEALDLGDLLLTASGTKVPVSGLVEGTQHTADAYNLTVHDINTYYVVAGNTSVLVHNCGLSLEEAIARGARTTSNYDEVARRLAQHHGIDPDVASARLHAIKRANGLGGSDNVVFDLTGNVWDPRTGDYLGSLTQGGAGGYVP